MNNQDINTEFSSFIKTYTKENPSTRLSEIAKRRNIELSKLDANSLSNPDADTKAMRVWGQAKSDLEKLIDPMPDTLWNLAYKYFSDLFLGGETDEEKREAISDECGLPDNRIDAENELAERVKEKICATEYTIGGNELTLFTEDEAQSNSIEDLCDILDERMSKMNEIIDQDTQDHMVFNDVQKNITFEEFFKALAAFLNQKVGAVLKTKDNFPIYGFSYDEEGRCLKGCHNRTGMEVVIVSPNINDEDDTGPIDDLLCDISVAGLGIGDLENPVHRNTKEMGEVLTYISMHRQYEPGDDGEYEITGVKGSKVPELVYNAVQDWQATTTACHIVTNEWNRAKDLLGQENMSALQDNVRRNEYYNSLANSNGISTAYAESYKKKKADREARAEDVSPKVNANGEFRPDDISDVIKKAQSALGGPLEFDEEDLRDISGIED